MRTFQLNRMEPLLISFVDVSFFNFFDPEVRSVKYRDYGPIFPRMIWFARDVLGIEGVKLRIVPGIFFIFAIAWMLFVHFRRLSFLTVASAALLLISNRYFVYFCTLISPYSLSFFLTFVSLYFYEHSETRSRRLFAVALGALAIIVHYTAVLPVLVAVFLHARQGYFRNRLYLLSSILLIGLASVPKGLMIYQLRFVERRASEGSERFQLADYFGALAQFFGSFSRSHYLGYTLLAVVLVVALAAGVCRHSQSFQARWLRMSLAVGAVSFVAMKAAGLYEIEPRYYFQLLPFIYIEVVQSLLLRRGGRAMVMVIVALSLCLYWMHKDDKYQPIESAARFFAERLRAGDQVCSPEQTYYALSVRNTLMYAQNIKQLDGVPTEDYFQCEKAFRSRGLPTRIWIFSRNHVSLPFNCRNNPTGEDCAAKVFSDILARRRDAPETEIRASHHDSVYAKLYTLGP